MPQRYDSSPGRALERPGVPTGVTSNASSPDLSVPPTGEATGDPVNDPTRGPATGPGRVPTAEPSEEPANAGQRDGLSNTPPVALPPTRPASPLERLPAWLMRRWVRPEVLPERPDSVIDPDRPVLYLLEVGGLADRTALDIVCRDHGLPRPGDDFAWAGVTERTSVDVLKRRQGLLFRPHRDWISPRLTRLVAASADRTTSSSDLQIVPVSVYWGRAPERESSFWRLFYTEDWAVAGRTRKMVKSIVHGRNVLVGISEPLSLAALRASAPDATDAALVRKLARILRVHFRQRRLATLGPDQSHRRMLIGMVLADRGVRRAIDRETGGEARKRPRVRNRAEKYAREIAADVSYPTVRMLQRPLTRLWNELYDGVKLDGLERLRGVADGREIVYVPCHRSHIDYLLLSYLLYSNGFSLPHVAAGVNLNLPFFGGILRRGGAFFLRRSFSGNPLYAAVFNAYLKEILQRGHSLEYFIEGGRSRTGRLLPPKGGMLAMTAHAYLRDPRTPVVFVPIYFGYERLLEGSAFTSELSGGKKQKETVFALLKSLRKLREDYGRVHVNIGEPITLDPLLTRHREGWRAETVDEERPEWLVPVVDELGQTIMRRINEAASVTPVSLLATALLATPRGNLGRDELEQQIALYGRLLETAWANTTVVVPPVEPARTIDHARELRFVTTDDDDIGPLVKICPGQAAPLTYFRNNILHLLTLPALIAAAFTNNRSRDEKALRRLVAVSYPFLQAELFLDDEVSDETLSQTLEALARNGLVIRREDGLGWQRAAAGTTEAVSLMRLAQVVMPALERDYLCASLLARAPGGAIARGDLEKRCRLAAERLATTHGRYASDLYDKALFGIFVRTLESRGFAVRDGDELRATEAMHQMEHEARTLLGEQVRHAILAAVIACGRAEGDAAADGAERRKLGQEELEGNGREDGQEERPGRQA